MHLFFKAIKQAWLIKKGSSGCRGRMGYLRQECINLNPMIRSIPFAASILLVVVFSTITACKKKENKELDPPTAETNSWLFVNAKVYTVDEAQPWAEAILVENGVIQFVGSRSAAEAAANANTRTVDLDGQLVLPGIHDVHMHPLEASSSNFDFTIDDSETDAENYKSDVTNAMNRNPGNGWLLGWGHYLHTVLDASRSPIEILDEVAPDRPIAIMEQSSHSIWCNSKALEDMNITDATPDPVGGVIMRDENGKAIGILIDNAGNRMIDHALESSNNTERNDYLGLLEYGLPQLARNGITSACDARAYWKRNHHKTWKRIADEGSLTARINLGLWAYASEEDASQISTLKSLFENDPGSLLRINQIKLYSDGIPQNTTAALHSDYHIDLFHRPTNNGVNYFTEARIGEYIAALEGTGFDFHIHAIGNRGITEALNAIEQNGSSNGRHRLTHLEIVDPTDFTRFEQLNVTADCQVAGDFTNPENWAENEAFIGSALSNNIVPIKSLTDANARLTLSSDWDVSTLNPFQGIQHAVMRDPQAISLEQAIKAYTINAAYVMRQEDRVGSIKKGKEADLIVMNQNIFEIAPAQIGQTRVMRTYLQGRLVFSR